MRVGRSAGREVRETPPTHTVTHRQFVGPRPRGGQAQARPHARKPAGQGRLQIPGKDGDGYSRCGRSGRGRARHAIPALYERRGVQAQGAQADGLGQAEFLQAAAIGGQREPQEQGVAGLHWHVFFSSVSICCAHTAAFR